MDLIKIENLNKNFGEKQILKDITLTIPKGKIIGLLGKNGTGKTTLIKIINDLLTPSSGSVLIKGKNVGVESKKIISYLPERTYLDKSMTVENILNYFNEFYENFDIKKARKLLKDLNLDTTQKSFKETMVEIPRQKTYIDRSCLGIQPNTKKPYDSVMKNLAERIRS